MVKDGWKVMVPQESPQPWMQQVSTPPKRMIVALAHNSKDAVSPIPGHYIMQEDDPTKHIY